MRKSSNLILWQQTQGKLHPFSTAAQKFLIRSFWHVASFLFLSLLFSNVLLALNSSSFCSRKSPLCLFFSEAIVALNSSSFFSRKISLSLLFSEALLALNSSSFFSRKSPLCQYRRRGCTKEEKKK